MTGTNVGKMGEMTPESDPIYFPTPSRPLLRGVALTLLISLFLRVNSLLGLGNALYDANVNSILLYAIVFAVQFTMGTVLIFVILPWLMADSKLIERMRSQVRPSRQLVITGLVSGGIFLFTALAVSNILGISVVNWSVLLANPDVYVDPDVTGWFYFFLALVPAIFEEIVFRGIILYELRSKFSDRVAILGSSFLFALYHFSVSLVQPIDTVIGKVIMSFFFGLAWGSLVLKTNSILPVMIAHYVVDSFGIVFLNIGGVDPMVATQYMLIITLLYPIIHWMIFRIIQKRKSNP